MTHSLRVAGAQLLGGDMLWLTLDAASTPLAAAYTGAGQYVTLSTRGSPPGFFAMASRPGAPRFEFLIRVEYAKPKTAMLAGLALGDAVEVSEIQGTPYPLDAQLGRELLFVAGGTGIAPIRAAMYAVAAHPEDYAGVTLVYGVNRPSDLVFRDDLARWSAAGVRVVPCARWPDDDWQGAVGLPTEVVEALHLRWPAVSAFLCGPQAMTQPLAELLTDQGVPRERVFENV